MRGPPPNLPVRATNAEADEMRCARCAKGNLVEIRMRIGEADVVFRRCGKCEAQGWEGIEGNLSLQRVLDMARVPR